MVQRASAWQVALRVYPGWSGVLELAHGVALKSSILYTQAQMRNE